MEVIFYQLSFSKNQKRFTNEIEFYKELKKLRQLKIAVTPLVLVKNVPGKSKPTCLKLNEYKKLLKKEGQADGNKESS